MSGRAPALPRTGDVFSPKQSSGRMPGTTPFQRRCLGALRRQVPISDDNAGSVTLPLDEKLLRKLNENTFRVLDALWSRRDRMGLTHVTLDGIARATGEPREETNGFPLQPLAERTVRSALERLKTIGLLENLGWGFKAVPCNCEGPAETHLHEVLMRRVLGAIVVTPATASGFSIRVPTQTAKWIREARMHGGKREGAGRPKGSKDAQKRWQFSDPNLERPEGSAGPFVTAPVVSFEHPELNRSEPSPGRWRKKTEAEQRALDESRARAIARAEERRASRDSSSAEENQDRRPIKCIKDPLTSNPSDSRKEGAAEKAPAALSIPSSERPEGGAIRAPAQAVSAALADRGEEPGAGRALAGGSNGSARALAHLATTGMPRFPGPTVLEPARVPDPPKLDTRFNELMWVDQLVAGFRTVAQHYFGEKAGAIAAHRARGKAFQPTLLQCARLLHEHGIAPLAWIAWSFDIWRSFNREEKRKQTCPPAKWIFSPNRIVERHGWFQREECTFRGGRVIFSPAHLELARRWRAMEWDLGGGISPDESAAKHFPGNLYEQLVERARLETAEIQTRINGEVQAGHFLWF